MVNKRLEILEAVDEGKVQGVIHQMMTIDITNMCSHLQMKLFEEDGIYHVKHVLSFEFLKLSFRPKLPILPATS